MLKLRNSDFVVASDWSCLEYYLTRCQKCSQSRCLCSVQVVVCRNWFRRYINVNTNLFKYFQRGLHPSVGEDGHLWVLCPGIHHILLIHACSPNIYVSKIGLHLNDELLAEIRNWNVMHGSVWSRLGTHFTWSAPLFYLFSDTRRHTASLLHKSCHLGCVSLREPFNSLH